MLTATETITTNVALTDALWAWMTDRMGDFADECLTDEDTMVDGRVLADWTEDAIREDVACELTAMVLLQACRLADWAELTGRAEEVLEV